MFLPLFGSGEKGHLGPFCPLLTMQGLILSGAHINTIQIMARLSNGRKRMPDLILMKKEVNQYDNILPADRS